MTSSVPTSWKAQRWLAAVTMIFLLQFLFIYFLSARRHGATRSRSKPFLLQVASAHWTESKFSRVFLTSDPALFALPGAHAFSGAAWLKNPGRGYDAGNLFEQKESPFWLTLNVGELGHGINRFVRSNTVAPMLGTEDSAPKVQTRLLAVADEAKTNSQLRVEGELASRHLLSSQELVAWPHTNILNNSVAQVAVNQSGMVILARLLWKSGSEQADRSAMDAARRFQFTSDKRPIVWGNLIFDWHTLPVEATNATVQPK